MDINGTKAENWIEDEFNYELFKSIRIPEKKESIFIFPTKLKEELNKVFVDWGVTPMGKGEKSRVCMYGTFYLSDYLPEDSKDGYTFELEDMEQSLWPNIIQDEDKYQQGKQRGWWL